MGFAALEAGTGAVSSMGSAFEPIKGDIIAGLAAVAPYAIAVLGAFLVWKYGVKFFKHLSK